MTEPIAHYPAGTPVNEVMHFDRGQKIAFRCEHHPETSWVSKDPYSSHWFPAVSADAPPCDCHLSEFVVAEDYYPTRSG